MRAKSLAPLSLLPLFLALAALVLTVGACKQNPAPVSLTQSQFYDFEDGIPDAFSATDRLRVGGRNWTLGPFNNRKSIWSDDTTLAVKGIPQGAGLQIEFDLYYIGNWESEGKLRDRFWVVDADGNELYSRETFPCKIVNGNEKNPVGADGMITVRKHTLGYWIEPCTLRVPPSSVKNGVAAITFKGQLSGSGTEMWTLDNVRASVTK